MKNVFLAIIATLLFASCSPMNKESYFKKFASFVEETSLHYKEYTQADWERVDQKYEKFTGEWYDKFENEISISENLKISKYIVKYTYYRAYAEGKGFLDEIVDSIDIDKTKQEIDNVTEDIIDITEEVGETLDSLAKEWTE